MWNARGNAGSAYQQHGLCTTMQPEFHNRDVDAIIVGAGLAGLSCALRLQEARLTTFNFGFSSSRIERSYGPFLLGVFYLVGRPLLDALAEPVESLSTRRRPSVRWAIARLAS